jgi:spermidine synthase
VLDGIIQCTDVDESSYQEMISHVPLFSHPNPRKVLVIGGGDGGVIREIDKHPEVEQVVQCEIDKEVIRICKNYFPNMAVGFNSSKLVQFIGDGKQFLKDHTEEFDVIITDSSDPIGPAQSLFTEDYYQLVKNALKPDGLACSQGECFWLHTKVIKEMVQFTRKLFPVVSYYSTAVPTYPCGQIGFLICSKNVATCFEKPLRPLSDSNSMGLKWYSAEMHCKSFIMPQMVREVRSITLFMVKMSVNVFFNRSYHCERVFHSEFIYRMS